jgi:hypothetical protein
MGGVDLKSVGGKSNAGEQKGGGKKLQGSGHG